LALHTRRATYDPGRPFTAWVHAIARYKLNDHLRQRYAQPVAEADDIEFMAADDQTAGTEAQLDVSSLLATIPAGQRAWTRGVRIEGRSVAEVAEGAGASPSAVKVGIHRGLKALAGKVRAKS